MAQQPGETCHAAVAEMSTIGLSHSAEEKLARFIREDIPVLRYQRLKDQIFRMTAVDYFAATFLGQELKLKILWEKLLIIFRRFFGVPPFRFHALADGI